VKRFYKQVTTPAAESGFGIALDGKPVKTPARVALVLPTKTLAKAVAAEWRAQGDKVLPETMPLTRLANSAIDRTRLHKDIAIDEIMNFARHDLLCYRADGPGDLAAIEAGAWDPYLKWAKECLGLDFKVTAGIETVEQDSESLNRLRGLLMLLDPFVLTSLHNATSLSGSAILALALWEGQATPKAIWRAGHVDEDYQKNKWGADGEAEKVAAAKRALWLAAGRFLEALKNA